MGISKKTIYKHFRCKYDLISSVVDAHLALEKRYVLETVSGSGTWIEKIKQILCHRACEHNYNLIAELQRFYPDEWKKAENFMAFLREKTLDLIKEGICKGEVRPETEKLFPVIDFLLSDRIMHVIDCEFGKNNSITIFQAIEGVMDIILYGIIKRKETDLS